MDNILFLRRGFIAGSFDSRDCALRCMGLLNMKRNVSMSVGFGADAADSSAFDIAWFNIIMI